MGEGKGHEMDRGDEDIVGEDIGWRLEQRADHGYGQDTDKE
jgi:hypothetical protein